MKPKTICERVELLDRLYLEADEWWRLANRMKQRRTRERFMNEYRKASDKYRRAVKQKIPAKLI